MDENQTVFLRAKQAYFVRLNVEGGREFGGEALHVLIVEAPGLALRRDLRQRDWNGRHSAQLYG